MKNWVVQYVYATEKNEQGVEITHIEAEDYESAKALAVKNARAEEYIVTVHPQSDDQFLGTVKHQANMIVGKGLSTEEDLDD